MVNKIAVDGKAIPILAEVYPIRFDLNGTVTLLEKENVRNHIRTGVGLERIVRQTNGVLVQLAALTELFIRCACESEGVACSLSMVSRSSPCSLGVSAAI